MIINQYKLIMAIVAYSEFHKTDFEKAYYAAKDSLK